LSWTDAVAIIVCFAILAHVHRMGAHLVPDSPRLAIFDHDGVLVDSYSLHELAWLELGRRRGLPLTREFVHRTFGMTNPMIFRELFEEDLDPQYTNELGYVKEECYRDVARGKLELMAGVRDLLDGLTVRGWLLAIGSSAPRANLELTVESCHLQGRFATIVGLEDIRRGKPDPEVFIRAAENCGVYPSRCVVFEDALVGIQAAKAAGMKAVGVGTTHPVEKLQESGADITVVDLQGFDVNRL
jgi:HAD superfamily hydrolase (TIGR01509 family)